MMSVLFNSLTEMMKHDVGHTSSAPAEWWDVVLEGVQRARFIRFFWRRQCVCVRSLGVGVTTTPIVIIIEKF